MLDDLLLVRPILEDRFAVANPVLADRALLRLPIALGSCARLLPRLNGHLAECVDLRDFDAAFIRLLVRYLPLVLVERNVVTRTECVVVLPTFKRTLKRRN